jgi:protocatechuate 3,4-dioxygenase beta subunit
MTMNNSSCFASRRLILAGSIVAATSLALPPREVFARQRATLTPRCEDGDEPTMPETAGPYFKPQSPLRSDLREPGIVGRPVELTGHVLTRACRPLAGAVVDLWHANDSGEYDNKGFRLRGHVFTGSEGRYAFHTILPGLYPGRTRHYHVKVQAPGSDLLTTQFYFPNEERNQTDGLFRSELVMRVADREDSLLAQFDVVLAAG